MPTEREQIAQAYQQQLGRAASEDELNQWLSGGYGWGQAGNIAPILNAIGQSGEAQAYQTRRGQSPTQQAVLGTMAGRDQLRRGSTGTMLGFNLGDYGGDVKARTSVKNMFSRIASRYTNAPGSVDAVMNDPDFKALFPNARRVGHDKIDFGGVMSDFETGTPVGVVDVLQASDPTRNTATGWQWLPDEVAQGGPANAAYNRTQAAIVGVPKPTVSTTMPVPTSTSTTGESGPTMDDQLQRYYQLVAAYLAQAEQDAQAQGTSPFTPPAR
jgi:hypothetical protein